MSHKYTLAYCIPVYHAEKYIGRMVASICAQKVGFASEIVLAVDPRDDTDYSFLFSIVSSAAKAGLVRTELIIKHCAEGHGMSAGAARNEAFNACDADFVWFVDADDWLCSADAAGMMVGVAKTNHCGICECQFEGPFPCKRSRMMAWLRILSYDIAEDHPFPDQPTQEDRDMYIQLAGDPRYASARVINLPFYHYDWGRADSVTGGKVLR